MHATRFGVGGIDNATRFVNCGEVTKRTGNVPHIVIDGFRNANNGKGMAALLAGLVQRVSAALGTIPANAEQHIHSASMFTGPREVPSSVPPCLWISSTIVWVSTKGSSARAGSNPW